MPHLLGPEQERRLISVLAVDLVGFAAAAQVLDVEDLHVAQREFFSLVAAAVLNADGTIAKRIGDAVVAVFGVPTAHENDAYRAVWAGLEIQAALAAGLLPDGRPMVARAGVVTGEALVFYEPGRDEPRVAGEVLSQAMAMQAAALAGTVAVGAHTQRSTQAQVDYAPLPVRGQHRADTWKALGVKARPGQVADALPMVGREPELQLLVSGARRALQERRGQVVTLVGPAGLGKSRLTRALAEHLDSPATPTMVRWRVGQCPSYGQGVTYGALVQIVKAQAAILESDNGAVACDKLDASIDGLLRSATPDVLAQTKERLAALLGLPGARSDLTEDVAASEVACRRYLLALADDAPTVLVLEDLHWADDAFLDFVRSVVDGATTVPLLVLGTARPELLERRADWVTGSGDAIAITLMPLPDGEMVDLMAHLLGPVTLPEALQRRLLDLVDGVPLYAEEYVRMLGFSGALAEGALEVLADLPLPDTVQGVLDSRLDLLSAAERGAVSAAAVVGETFWDGAVAAVAGADRAEVLPCLEALELRAVIRRAAVSTVTGEQEFVFHHGLVRDAAYARIPLSLRVGQHHRCAQWLDSLSREDDLSCEDNLAELRAHHRLTAHQLAADLGLDPSLTPTVEV